LFPKSIRQSGKKLLTLKAQDFRVNSVAYSSKGRCIVSASIRILKVRYAQVGQEQLTTRANDVNSVLLSPDDQRIVPGGSALQAWGRVEMWCGGLG